MSQLSDKTLAAVTSQTVRYGACLVNMPAPGALGKRLGKSQQRRRGDKDVFGCQRCDTQPPNTAGAPRCGLSLGFAPGTLTKCVCVSLP